MVARWNPYRVYVEAPGPEANANGDPMVITRYSYKPTASEGLTRFNDNRRPHIYVVDIATRKVTQLTEGNHDEHWIDWSPSGDESVRLEPQADPDRVFQLRYVRGERRPRRRAVTIVAQTYARVRNRSGRRTAR